MSDPAPHSGLLATPLNTALVGSRVLVFDEVGSTNTLGLRMSGHGIVIAADRQTAGRGRHGRSWESAPGLGLWFSVGFDGRLEGLMFAAALAVRRALRPHCPIEVKWPNDLLIGGKKVCGILVEHRRNRTALGIGINVHHRRDDFPESLRATATSLELATQRAWNRAEVLRDVLTELDTLVLALLDGGYERIRGDWAAACNIKGRRVRYDDTEAVVADIDGDGALIVATPSGAHRLVSGEVEVMYAAGKDAGAPSYEWLGHLAQESWARCPRHSGTEGDHAAGD